MDTNKAPSRISDILSLVPDFVRERRLPWRLSQIVARYNLALLRWYYDRRVLSTRPYMTGGDCLHFEVHTMLGHKHVGMALWAVKSFLHFARRKFTVVLHDDGSLTESDIKILNEHLINAKIVMKSTADKLIEERITSFPNCREYRFGSKDTSDHRGIQYNMHIFSVPLFDFNLVSNATKIFMLDADVLFFKEPREIIEWAEDAEDRNSLYSVEQYAPRRNSRNEIIDYELKIPRPTDGNAGMFCFDKRAFNLDLLDKWIGDNKVRMSTHATFGQAAYNYLIKAKGGSSALPDTYSFNYTDQDVIATHFAIKMLFFKNIKRLTLNSDDF